MRLNEYLTEKMEQLELFPDDYYRFGWQNGWTDYHRQSLNLIKAECSQIIREYKNMGHILFRGTNSKRMTTISENIFKVFPRFDRQPKDTNIIHQEHIDDVFYKKFNWRPRSEGVFVIGSSNVASTYGILYAFFPVNGYEYLWSPKYSDLYSDYFGDKSEDDDKYDPFAHGGYWRDEENKIVNLYSLMYKSKSFIKKENQEDPLKIKLYLKNREDKDNPIVKIATWHPDVTEEEWNNTHITLDDVVNTYKNNNLGSSSRSKMTEVMFKCKYYYLIKLFRPTRYNYQTLTVEDLGLI